MKLFVFGLGYTAQHFLRQHGHAFTDVVGTVRSAEKAERLKRDGIAAVRFAADQQDASIVDHLRSSAALLVSTQPTSTGDPVLSIFAEQIAAARHVRSVVYLSTIGVYGDHGGAWIDETAPLVAANPRQAARIDAERAWIDLGEKAGIPVTVLRLAGIYGPSRNVLVDLRDGEARRIDKPGQVFNRIHVADIGQAILASITSPACSRILNVTDDEPAPAPDVVSYAARLMGVEPPPLLAFAEAELSPMARSFYGANRRVRNGTMKASLGFKLLYPTYRSGLDALWASGEGKP